MRLLADCPEAAVTPLVDDPRLADAAGVGRLWVKDERGRMGLGSFKALGAAYVIARDAQGRPHGRLEGVTYVAASAGNHGLSLAAGASAFGANAVVFIAESVPDVFAARLAAAGAEVIRRGSTYEESMAAAADAAAANGWSLLSDSSWPGYVDTPRRVMEGYLAMGAEIVEQLGEAEGPTHVFLQAGVGGMAAAMAGFVRGEWGDAPRVVVVEPETARPLMESIRAGEPVRSEGPASVMGRLDCKETSHVALGALARWADMFVTVTDAEAIEACEWLSGHNLVTSPSGGAGLAAVRHGDRDALGLDATSRVLAIITESSPEESHGD